ncbi:MAG: glutamate 5-kinase, partial [Bacteroidales bacterium]|nr:glutamate 5-kinase [Bacteroidales bacterium]
MYTADPAQNASAKLISKVVNVEEDIEKYIFDGGTAFSTGGMSSKIAAARLCAEHEVDMVITNGSDPAIIYDVLEGKDKGTLFLSKKTAANF